MTYLQAFHSCRVSVSLRTAPVAIDAVHDVYRILHLEKVTGLRWQIAANTPTPPPTHPISNKPRLIPRQSLLTVPNKPRPLLRFAYKTQHY